MTKKIISISFGFILIATALVAQNKDAAPTAASTSPVAIGKAPCVVGALDIDRVIAEFSVAQDVIKEMQAQEKKASTHEEVGINNLKKQQAEYEAKKAKLKDVSLSTAAKENISKELVEMEKKMTEEYKYLSETHQKVRQILQKQQQEKLNVVLKDIQPRIVAVAKEKKLSMVVNMKTLFFLEPAYDITPDVIALLKKDFPVKENKGIKEGEKK